MNKKIRYLATSVVASAMLSACGFFDDDDDDSGGSQPPPEPMDEVFIEGSAVKGLLKNVKVSVYLIQNGAKQEPAILETVADVNNGMYEGMFPVDHTGPVAVYITSLAPADEGFPSIMMCDIPDSEGGCGEDALGNTVGYGGAFALGADFRLRSLLRNVVREEGTDRFRVNISALTEMAAAFADTFSSLSSEVIQVAQLQVATLFDLDLGGVDLALLPVLDVTDPAAVEALASDPVALKAASITAALLVTGVQSGQSIEEAIAQIVMEFADNGGQMILNGGDGVVDLSEILAAALLVVAAVEAQTGISFDELVQDITGDKTDADNAEPGTYTEIEPPDLVFTTELEQVIAFVDDIRQVVVAGNGENVDGIKDGTELFKDRVEAAEKLINDQLTIVDEVLEDGAMAIAEAAEAYNDDSSLREFTYEEIQVNITPDVENPADIATYVIDQVVNDVDLDMSALGNAIQDSTTEDEFGNTVETSSGSATNVTAMANTDTVMVSLTHAAGGTMTWNIVETKENGTRTSKTDLSLTELMASIHQKGATVNEMFDGKLGLSVVGSMESETESEGTETTVTSFTSMSFDFNGTFTTPEHLNGETPVAEESFDAQVLATVDGSGYTKTEIETGDSEEEIKEGWIDYDIDMNFTANLIGVDTNTAVEIDIDRNDENTYSTVMTLDFSDRDLIIESSELNEDLELEDSAQLTIRNSIGVSMMGSSASGAFEGTLYHAGVPEEQMGTVSETDDDVFVVRYMNGFFETLQ